MQKIIALATSIIITLLLGGCTGVSEDMQLAVCGSYAVPGMFCHDLKGGTFSCRVQERDNQGRILFLYEAQNIITDQTESVYVICQKLDANYVYFYEDICYTLETNENSDVDLLKLANDWNRPLEQKRMSKRKLQISHDLFIMTDSKLQHNEIKAALCKELEITTSQIETLVNLDVNQAGQELFLLTVDNGCTMVSYYVITDLDLDVRCTLAEQTSLFAFKQSSNWIYG